jgi:aminobenzoyl-glutamate utilization protein A
MITSEVYKLADTVLAKKNIIAAADQLRDYVVSCRRDFHKHAEVGWTEFRTGSIVARTLLDMGGWQVEYGPSIYDKSLMMGMPSEAQLEKYMQRAIAQGGDKEIIEKMRGGYTGVVATLVTGDGNGPTVAFRVDIDANDLIEAKEEKHRPYREGFASINDGAMHGCGHDCHTATGLLAARILLANKDLLPPGKIKIIFQTGEEGGRGGQPMAAAGVADGADYFMAIHVGVQKDGALGGIAAGVSHMMNSTKSDVFFKGVSAHAGGDPDKGKNALLAAANAVINLYAISRHSAGTSRVNVGVLEAGVGRNVIADRAMMKMEVRGETDTVHEYMQERALAVIEGAAKMYGVDYVVKKAGQTITAPCDDKMVDFVVDAAMEIPGIKRAIRVESMSGGGEDCTFFMRRVQAGGGIATMAMIGTNGPAVAHNEYFDVDEEVLLNGAKLIGVVAVNALAKGKAK